MRDGEWLAAINCFKLPVKPQAEMTDNLWRRSSSTGAL